jgi:opacity protein-like surface antigen
MKKLVFTALAAVAFSGVAMANDLAVKEKAAIVLSADCDGIAHDTYYIWYGRGYSEQESREKARAAKADCEANPPKEITEA